MKSFAYSYRAPQICRFQYDFCVLPMPLYDEGQDEYYCVQRFNRDPVYNPRLDCGRVTFTKTAGPRAVARLNKLCERVYYFMEYLTDDHCCKKTCFLCSMMILFLTGVQNGKTAILPSRSWQKIYPGDTVCRLTAAGRPSLILYWSSK